MEQCRVCGHENRDAAKFCEECASPLPAADNPAAEVRKTVTIVFCDVVGSTAMGEALDPESLRHVMQRYFEVMRAAIERHGGTVEKFIGDAVMAVFGVPKIHEDDALRAVRAASDMRDDLAALNHELERDHGTRVDCRIGVNTGEVVAGAGDQTIVTGDAVNVAARLEQAAARGEVLLGEETYRLVRDAILSDPVDALNLKGKSDPVTAHRLLRVTPGAAGFARHLDAPIVGRERELSLLRDAFERTVSDHACQLFTVLGIGGVGKSRLLAAFVDELGGRARVLRGRCLPYGEGITFWPLAEALIDAAELNEADSPTESRAKLAALMGPDEHADRIVDCVAQAIGIAGSESAPEETLWAIRMLLERLADERPLVFMIDDLQWGETKFLELVEHVGDRARDAPILLACMARPELLDDHPGWAGGKLNATSILLEPLKREECGTLVANLLADDTVDEQVRMRIAEAAEGHPLYAEEITGLLVDEGRLVLQDGRWVATGDLSDVPVPPTIAALLAARLDRLPSIERRLLAIASVIGQVFYSSAVRDLASDGPDAVEVGLTSLVRKQFVRPERSDLPATDALGFRHLLIRDAAYDAIPKATRAELHERFADWLAQAGSVGEADELLGYHLEQAYRHHEELGPPGKRERELAIRASRHLSSAARRATVRIDLSVALSLFARAVSLLVEDDAGYPELLWEYGTALNRGGSETEAEPVLDEVIRLASSGKDERLEARARLDRWFSRWVTDPHGILDRMPREVGALIPALEDRGDDLGLTKAWQLIASGQLTACRYAAMSLPLERALVHARRAGDRLEETEVIQYALYECWFGPMPVGDAIRRCEEILLEVKGDRRIEAEVLAPLGALRAMLGQFDEARDLVARHRDVLRDLGLLYWAWGASMALWEVETLAGDAVSAERVVRAAYDTLAPSEDARERSQLAARLAHALCTQGRDAEAIRYADICEEIGADWVMDQILWRSAKARALAHIGELEQGLALAREAVTLSEATDAIELQADVLTDLAEVVSISGGRQEAATAFEEALALYRQKGNLVSSAKAQTLLDGIRT